MGAGWSDGDRVKLSTSGLDWQLDRHDRWHVGRVTVPHPRSMDRPAVEIPSNANGEQVVAPQAVLQADQRQRTRCMVAPGKQDPTEKGEHRGDPIAVKKCARPKLSALARINRLGVRKRDPYRWKKKVQKNSAWGQARRSGYETMITSHSTGFAPGKAGSFSGKRRYVAPASNTASGTKRIKMTKRLFPGESKARHLRRSNSRSRYTRMPQINAPTAKR